MKYVIKLGGAAIEDPRLLAVAGKAIFELVTDGNQVAVVHGGGVQLTRTLAQMGKTSQFISGLRVTDAETRDAALMVLAGRVNKSLVASLGKHGQQAIGLSRAATATSSAPAKRRPCPIWASSARSPPPTPAGSKPSGKWVPSPSSRPSPSASMANTTTSTPTRWPPPARSPRTPTPSSSSQTSPASRGADGQVMRWLSLKEVPALERAAVVSGGMLPKLNACKDALVHGVKRVRILPAEAAALLPDLISSRVNEGTEVLAA